MAPIHHRSRSTIPSHLAGPLASDPYACLCCYPELEPIFPVRWKAKIAQLIVKKAKELQEKAKKQKERKEKSWIEIQLLDGDGDPIPDEKYVIELPDGKTKEGKLDKKGRARVADIDPGSCTVKFPDIEKQSETK